MLLSQVAENHRAARVRVTDAATAQGLSVWRQIDPAQLDQGWDAVAPSLVRIVTSAQTAAATQSAALVNAASPKTPAASLVPEAFAGVALDGREIGPAMFSAVTETKRLVGAGLAPARAFEVGAGYLATVIGAAIQDMGRQADMTLASGRKHTQYVRVVSLTACSRCAILAGKSSYMVAFKRHPRCKCTAMPIGTAGTQGLNESPEDYFASLTREQQDKVFTKAGAEAIRAGANPISVVNARRGAYGIQYDGHYNIPVLTRRLQPVTIGVRADGTPLQVFATSEGTTARGAFGRSELAAGSQAAKEGRYRRTTTLRLMPEQLVTMAGGNQDRLIELLTRYGYLA